MRTSLELIGLLLSLPIASVLGQHFHERRQGGGSNAVTQVQTQTLTMVITITATGSFPAASTNAANSNNNGNSNSNSNSSSSSSSSSSNSNSNTTDSATSTSSFPQAGSALDVGLIPPYGIQANVSLNDGTPRCAGLGGKAISCDCPPDPSLFVSSLNKLVASGQQQFPEGNTVEEQLTRLQTCIVTLQNIFGGPGSGVGCPAVSTNWTQLQSQLQSQLR